MTAVGGWIPEVSPERDDGDEVASQAPEMMEEQPSRGYLLDTTDPALLYKKLRNDWDRTERNARNAHQRDLRNTMWVDGRRYVRLIEKVPNQGLWEVSIPLGMGAAPPTPNHINDLRRKTIAAILVDPASPNVEPGSGDDADRTAALLASRYLTSDGQEGGTDDTRVFRETFDMASITRSAYQYLQIHPSAGGQRPKQLQAHPQATDPAQPLLPPAQPQIAPPAAPQGQGGAPPKPYDLRYVTPPQEHPEVPGLMQRSFTENPAEAEVQWVPKAVTKLLSPQQCRLLPDIATCDADATGIRLLLALPLDEWRAFYEDPSAPWSEETCHALAKWRPPRPEALVPYDVWRKIQDAPKNPDEDGSESVPGETICFAFVAYEKCRPAYPEGACVVVSGAEGGTVLHQDNWLGMVELPDGTQSPESLELPISQLRPLSDPSKQDALGTAMVELYGGADESLARIVGSVIEHMWKLLHPHTFVTSMSPLTQNAQGRRDDRLIVLGGPDEKPFFETMPQLPNGVFELVSMIKNDMRSSAGLEQAAQGQAATDVRSAQHARQLIEQSLTSMSEMFQAVRRFQVRFWRIKLQLARCFITTPQLAAYVSEDATEDIRWWTGADLHGARDIRIADGTGTMLPPSAKQEWLLMMQTNSWMSLQDAAEAARQNASPMVAFQEDPQRMRIDRELARWRSGPPEGWMPAQPQVDMMGQPMVNPMTGQPAMTAPSYTPFSVTPADTDPTVAVVRRIACVRAMGTPTYEKADQGWKALLDGVYAMSTQALQAAQQAQQQASQPPSTPAQEGGKKDQTPEGRPTAPKPGTNQEQQNVRAA